MFVQHKPITLCPARDSPQREQRMFVQHKPITRFNDTFRTLPQQVVHTHGQPARISMLVTVRELRLHPGPRAILLAEPFE